MNSLRQLFLALAACAVLSPSAPAAPPAAPETPIEDLNPLNGVVVLDNWERYAQEGAAKSMEKTVVVDGPSFLKQHEDRVKQVLQPYLGQPLSTNALHRMQQSLILLCRELDRPWVDVYYPQQKIVHHVVQIMVYEGRLGQISAVYTGRKWFSEKFITNNIHLRRGDSISQKNLIEDLNRLNVTTPLFLEVNVDVKLGKFAEAGPTNTDIDVVVIDRFPLRVFSGYDDYGVRALGENRVFAGLDYGNVWGLAHQFHYQYTTDTEFDHLRSHNASYVVPFAWGHSLTLFGGYSDLNADLGRIAPAPSPLPLRSSGNAYQISARYSVPLPQWGALDEVIAVGYDFKYANTPLLYDQVALNSFRAAIDQFVLSYTARLPDLLGYSDLSAVGYYSPGNMLGPNSTADFRTFAPGANNLTANYYYGHVNAERGFFLPLRSTLLFKGGYQAASERLLPSEEWYLGGDQVLRGYAENVVGGSEGYNATAEWHLPIFPNWSLLGTNQPNLTRQQNLPGVRGDTLEFLGFYDYGAVRPSGEESARYYLESVGAGLNLHVSQNLAVNFAYGFGLRRLPVQTYGPTPLLDGHRRGALLSATLSF
jgi:hemolysin activation/secretion protein